LGGKLAASLLHIKGPAKKRLKKIPHVRLKVPPKRPKPKFIYLSQLLDANTTTQLAPIVENLPPKQPKGFDARSIFWGVVCELPQDIENVTR
jgi:hypothetical protein